jgi:hypothetical protein
MSNLKSSNEAQCEICKVGTQSQMWNVGNQSYVKKNNYNVVLCAMSTTTTWIVFKSKTKLTVMGWLWRWLNICLDNVFAFNIWSNCCPWIALEAPWQTTHSKN